MATSKLGEVILSANTQPAAPAELDELTLRRAQRGDDAACRALVKMYERRLFGLLARVMGTRPEVQDVAQETYLAVFSSLAKFDGLGPAKLSTWILTIGSRRAIDWLRQNKPKENLIVPWVGQEPSKPETSAELDQKIAWVMQNLSPQDRVLLVLREVYGFELSELARVLALELGTVKSRLHRSKLQFKQAFAAVQSEDVLQPRSAP